MCTKKIPDKLPIPDGTRSMEIMLPMRDGIELHTLLFFPRGGYASGKKYSVVMDRSPYGYGDMEWITDLFVPADFVGVGQDMRGTEKSEGAFSLWTSDKNDSQDLGDWIAAQDWSNGKIMTIGASADGMGSLQTVFYKNTWLAAQYVAWAPSKVYDILFPYGNYKQETVENWLMGLTMPDPSEVYKNIDTVHQNEMRNDFWAQVELREAQFANVNFPSAFWGGWYDLFVVGTIDAFTGYNELSDPSVRYTSKITIDPLGHCIQAGEFFPQNTYEGRTLIPIVQMLEVFGVRPVTRDFAIKNVTFYVMSSNDEAGLAVGQYWTSLDSFPKHLSRDYYFHSDKTLSTSRPTNIKDGATSSYVYDPSNPLPTNGGNNLPPDIGGDIACGPLDQNVVEAGRTDLLTFTTEALSDALYLTGPLLATLYVESDAVDTDFMVKISDVYPTGEARLIQDNAVRMRWREATQTPVYMEKGNVYEVNVNLWNTSYVIAPGHKIRVAVTSSNNPRFSINPNNGLLLSDASYPGANITATNVLHHSLTKASKITLPVVSKWQVPQRRLIEDIGKGYPSCSMRRARSRASTPPLLIR